MAISGGPNIITDSLILAIDGANPKSYPGSGTVWGDISGEGNNITLINGPTFDTDNGGNILFDGINDWGSFSELNVSPPWTVDITFRTNRTAALDTFRQTLLGNDSPTAGLIRLYSNQSSGTSRTRIVLIMRTATNTGRTVNGYISPFGSNYVDPNLQDEFWKDKIFNLTIAVVPAGVTRQSGYYFYLNGEFKVRANVDATDNINLVTSQLGSRESTLDYFSGNIFSTRIYDRDLTDEEVLQNYNATKTRFGL